MSFQTRSSRGNQYEDLLQNRQGIALGDVIQMANPARRTSIAAKESVPKTEVLRRMFTILRITQEEKKKGNELA
jgi:hypothetical protein